MFNVGDKVYYKHEQNNMEYLAQIAMRVPGHFNGGKKDAYLLYAIDRFGSFSAHRFEALGSIDYWVGLGAEYDIDISTRESFSRLIREEHLRLAVDNVSQCNNSDTEEDRGGFKYL